MDGRDGLQLLPGTKKKLGIKVPGENKFLYIGSAILGAVLVTSFALARYEKSLGGKIENINSQLLTIEQQRDKEAETSLSILKKRLDLTGNFIDNHKYWTKALSRITSLLQKEVQLISFSGGTEENSIGIEGYALSFTVLARQIASFLTDDAIQDLTLGLTDPTSNGTIRFTMILTFDRSKTLYKQ